MLPTLLVLSMSQRGRLRLMLSMVLMDTLLMVLTPMLVSMVPMLVPMELTPMLPSTLLELPQLLFLRLLVSQLLLVGTVPTVLVLFTVLKTDYVCVHVE